MKKSICAAAIAGALAAFPQAAPLATYNCEPVNPNATPEARALLKRIQSSIAT